jgi:hypothetical protein
MLCNQVPISPFHVSAFDNPGFAKLSCYFSLPPTFFIHMVAQELPNFNAIAAPTLPQKPTNSSALIDLSVSRDVGFQPSYLIIS